MAFSTNMTGRQILEAHRQQQLHELSQAKAWRDHWQAQVDKLERATARPMVQMGYEEGRDLPP